MSLFQVTNGNSRTLHVGLVDRALGQIFFKTEMGKKPAPESKDKVETYRWASANLRSKCRRLTRNNVDTLNVGADRAV